EPCLVSDIISYIGKPDTPHSTISSIVRILERKGFVDHNTYGRTHEYFSIIKKEQYSKSRLNKMVKDYFDGSASRLVSFLVHEKEIDLEELNSLLDTLENEEE